MTYVSWAHFHEGPSDALYFDVLLPRLMAEIITREGIRHSDIPLTPAVKLGVRGRSIDVVAEEACKARAAFQVVFIHADTGGRALEADVESRAGSYCRGMHERCGWPLQRCVMINPRHETEAWILADPEAVTAALGYRGDHRAVGLPDNAHQAERLEDPKATLAACMRSIVRPRRRNRVDQLFPAIAQRQNLSALRGSQSFRCFEQRLKTCLADLGCIARSD